MSWVEQRKHGCRIQDYTQHGMRTVTLENRALRVTVLPDKGADIVELRLKALDLDVLWASPNGLRDPRVTHPSSEGLGAMMDFYEGGWQEILPSAQGVEQRGKDILGAALHHQRSGDASG